MNQNFQSNYQRIDALESAEFFEKSTAVAIDPNEGGNHHWRNFSKHSLISIVVLLVFAFLAGFAGGELRMAARETSTFSCSASCSFKQCTAAVCGSDVPYLCDEGAAANGCAATADFWPTSYVCTSCCSIIDCEETIAAGGDDTTDECTLCTESQCTDLAAISNQKCGSSAPYVCTGGSSRMGCNANQFYWTSLLPSQCSGCCDMTSCAA